MARSNLKLAVLATLALVVVPFDTGCIQGLMQGMGPLVSGLGNVTSGVGAVPRATNGSGAPRPAAVPIPQPRDPFAPGAVNAPVPYLPSTATWGTGLASGPATFNQRWDALNPILGAGF